LQPITDEVPGDQFHGEIWENKAHRSMKDEASNVGVCPPLMEPNGVFFLEMPI
jgi:hypothetical protein